MRDIPDSAPLSTWAAASQDYVELIGSSAGEAGGPSDDGEARRPDELTPTSGPPLILTGMHRSATSLFALYLTRSGIRLGDRLLGPLPSNPRGHFEDLDIAEVHERAIRRWETAGQPRGAAPDTFLRDDELAQLRDLVVRRKGMGAAWGFKDPRACLFLSFWGREIPEARFIILLRHPRLVTDSLCRRQERDTNTVAQNDQALAMWLGYNREVLRFVRRCRERCTLIHVDRAIADPQRAVRALSERTGYSFRADRFLAAFDPGLLHVRPEIRRSVSWRLQAQTSLLFHRLLARCDV